MKKSIKPKAGTICAHELERSSLTGRVIICSHPNLVKNTRHFCAGRKGETYITTINMCATCEFRELVMLLSNKPIPQIPTHSIL